MPDLPNLSRYTCEKILDLMHADYKAQGLDIEQEHIGVLFLTSDLREENLSVQGNIPQDYQFNMVATACHLMPFIELQDARLTPEDND